MRNQGVFWENTYVDIGVGGPLVVILHRDPHQVLAGGHVGDEVETEG